MASCSGFGGACPHKGTLLFLISDRCVATFLQWQPPPNVGSAGNLGERARDKDTLHHRSPAENNPILSRKSLSWFEFVFYVSEGINLSAIM